MDLRQLTPKLFVSPQIAKSDVAEIAAQGFSNIVNNRPDGEGVDQPDSLHILTACSDQGVHYRYIPVVGGAITEKDILEFREALDSAQGRALAFCRTGTRATKLWALSYTDIHEPNDLISIAAQAGYDIKDLKPALDARRQKHLGGNYVQA